jgi:hypothetical protein
MGSCLRRNLELPRAFVGSRRRQGSILQPLVRRCNGFLPSQEPRIAPRAYRIPAKAGIHPATAPSPAKWVPAFAGTSNCPARLSGPCAGRDPSCNRSSAGAMGLLPAQEPRFAPHASDGDRPRHRSSLSDPGAGRDPSYNRSFAGEKSSGRRRNLDLPRAFTGSRRRQGSIVQPLERRRHGFLPTQEPRIAPRVCRIPAQAGIHPATAPSPATWVPACAGTQACVYPPGGGTFVRRYVPAFAGTPNCPAWQRRRSAPASLLFTGSRRRQGSIVQPLERRRHGFLPAQEPKHVFNPRRGRPTGRRPGIGSRQIRYRPGGPNY